MWVVLDFLEDVRYTHMSYIMVHLDGAGSWRLRRRRSHPPGVTENE